MRQMLKDAGRLQSQSLSKEWPRPAAVAAAPGLISHPPNEEKPPYRDGGL